MTKKVESKENYTPIGKLYSEAQVKGQDPVDLTELRDEFTKDYMDNLLEAALKGKKNYTETYYVVVLTKKERLMQKVIRNYFLTRKTCPTPNYDQTVYEFNPKTEELSFLWLVPSKDACEKLYSKKYSLNNMYYSDLMPYVIDFMEGKLYKKAKKLNGETQNPGNALEK